MPTAKHYPRPPRDHMPKPMPYPMVSEMPSPSEEPMPMELSEPYDPSMMAMPTTEAGVAPMSRVVVEAPEPAVALDEIEKQLKQLHWGKATRTA